jgi:hypothetical protein
MSLSKEVIEDLAAKCVAHIQERIGTATAQIEALKGAAEGVDFLRRTLAEAEAAAGVPPAPVLEAVVEETDAD